jgi:hypothetical protein
MRDEIIKMIEHHMLNRTTYFTREQDIQIFLACAFEASLTFDQVYLEYHIPAGLIPNYPWTDSNNIYIDIVLLKDGCYYPIEIKYKTKSQAILHQIFGGNQQLILGHHGAQNIGCYDFWKDIKRLELYESTFQNVEQGIMLFVSNDETYLNPPLNLNAGYAQFSIHEHKLVAPNEILDWNRPLAISQNRPPIQLDREYSISWSPMQLENHFYILL